LVIVQEENTWRFLGGLLTHELKETIMKCKWMIPMALVLMLSVMVLPLQSFGDEEQADRDTVFLRAASKGNLKNVQTALRKKVNVNVTDSEGMTALMHAARRGQREMVEFLIKKGANPNVQDTYGMTAVSFAAYHGQGEIVVYLIRHGADPNLRSDTKVPRLSRKGATLLIAACVTGYAEEVKLFLDNGAQPDLQDDEGRTALMYASEKGYDDIVMLLLAAGAKINYQDVYGRTALMMAAIANQPGTARLLLVKGADPGIKDKQSMTALRYAQGLENAKVIWLLKGQGY
jgi:ankyrin repeat protein